MTQPLNVDPDDLLVTANGHLLLITQLGEVLDVTPSVPNGPWPSQAGVALMHGSAGALTGAMMARLGEHSAGLTQAAGSYTGQESGSAGNLKEGMEMFRSTLKDFAGLGTGLLKDGEGVIGNMVQVGANAAGSLGGALASGTAAMIGPATAAKPHPGTPEAAAPAAALDEQHQQQEHDRQEAT